MIMAWLAGAGPSPVDPRAERQLEHIRSRAKAIHFCVAASGGDVVEFAHALLASTHAFSFASRELLAAAFAFFACAPASSQTCTASASGLARFNLFTGRSTRRGFLFEISSPSRLISRAGNTCSDPEVMVSEKGSAALPGNSV
jgi:hypothetical protein